MIANLYQVMESGKEVFKSYDWLSAQRFVLGSGKEWLCEQVSAHLTRISVL